MKLSKIIGKASKNSIRVGFDGACSDFSGGHSYFGGMPELPSGFVWPVFTQEKEQKPHPLTFIAQFDCAELSLHDSEKLLPDKGIIAFFYDIGSLRSGYSPSDKGCAKVFLFGDRSALSPTPAPPEYGDGVLLPKIAISLSGETTYPGYEDFSELFPETEQDEYYEACKTLGIAENNDEGIAEDGISRVLGWPDIVNGNMTQTCELASRGYCLGDAKSWQSIPDDVLADAEENSCNNWQLLLQLDSFSRNGFVFSLGDFGTLYFYIRRSDLLAGDFGGVWSVLQC